MFETILLLWIKYKVGTIRGISSDATADAIFNIYDKQRDNKVDKFLCFKHENRAENGYKLNIYLLRVKI